MIFNEVLSLSDFYQKDRTLNTIYPISSSIYIYNSHISSIIDMNKYLTILSTKLLIQHPHVTEQ